MFKTADQTNTQLVEQLHKILPAERIKSRWIDRYAFSSDASHFMMVPQVVVRPTTIEEIQKLFALSQKIKVPMTFRAAGTSLCGQSITDGMLVDLSRHWRNITVEENGASVRVQPAMIGDYVNRVLKKFSRKIGPDPASINAAMMGGILANNSSGMCCGVQYNSFHTLKYITFVLPNGQVFNTEAPDEQARFEREAAPVFSALKEMRQEIFDNPRLHDKIRKKYLTKNTTGYGLNAFIDYEHPLDILAHLLIGSEGTLAFIAEAVMHTLPDLPYKRTGLLFFDSPQSACAAIFALKNTGAAALEFMDRKSLRSIESVKGIPVFIKNLDENVSVILTEYQAATEQELNEMFNAALPELNKLPLLFSPNFTNEPDEQALFWKVRKGLYPSVAAARKSGTAMMSEDIAFPVERLGEAVVDVQQLFEKYNYPEGIVFGHAKDGNLHFLIAQRFDTPEEIRRFEAFNDALFDLVLNRYKGALKAEHGTGRAVSPYVEAEWGAEAYKIMKRLKKLLDPDNLLNPDVIITEDKNTHLRHLKIMPTVEEEVDKCVECGFCERRCPSRDYTLTPRERIRVRRAIKLLSEQKFKEGFALSEDFLNKSDIRNQIIKDYQHDGLDTCAVDGMCATDCPVNINTGDLVKRLRRENHSAGANKRALFLAKNFSILENTARISLKAGYTLNSLFGENFMFALTGTFRKLVPDFPLWNNAIDNGKWSMVNGKSGDKKDLPFTVYHLPFKIVYFSSCISRMMNPEILNTFQSVCKKAGVDLIIPSKSRKFSAPACCGQIFSSKGFTDAYRHTANETIEKLWYWSEQGKIPVVIDVTSCTQTLLNSAKYLTDENKHRHTAITFLDSIDFAADVLLPRLEIKNKKNKIVFHPVCSVYKMGLLDKMKKIGNACAEQTDIPQFAGCCGMAGDRGFYYPELTRAAVKSESDEVKQTHYDGYYSSAKTCEINFSEAVGENYKSILSLLDEVS